MLITAIHFICSKENDFSRRDVLIETLKNANKHAKYQERLTFLCECRRSQIYPNFISSLVSPTLRVFRRSKTLLGRVERYRKELLNEAIQDTSRTLAFLQRQKRRLEFVRQDQRHLLTSLTENMADRIYWSKRDEQRRHLRTKFTDLMEKTQPDELLPSNGVTDGEDGGFHHNSAHPQAAFSCEDEDDEILVSDELQDLRATRPADDGEQCLWHDAVATQAAITSSVDILPDKTAEARATRPVDTEDLWFDAVSTPTEIDLLRPETTHDTTPSQLADEYDDQRDVWFDADPTSADILRAMTHDTSTTVTQQDDLEDVRFDAVPTPSDTPSLLKDDPDIWYDAVDRAVSDQGFSGANELVPPGEPLVSSSPVSSSAENVSPVKKLFNMTGAELESPLASVLEKGPKFAITQKVTKKTLNDVEVGIERAMFALRWKLEIEQKRGNLSSHAISTHQLKPHFADNDAAVPRLASAEIERAMAKLKGKVIGLYKNHRTSKSNVLSEEEEAIAKLSNNKSLIVKPSDKCKGFVIMKKETYRSRGC